MIQNQSAVVDVSAIANTTVVTGIPGKRIIVFGYVLINGVATAQSIVFKSGTTALSGVKQLPLSVGGGIVAAPGDASLCYFLTAPGDNLVLTTTAATQVGGHVAYKYS